MIKAGRTQKFVEHQTASGLPVRLAGQTWWAAVGGRWWGLAFGYEHPRLVEAGGTQVRVRDHVGMLRLLTLAAILMAGVIGRLAR